MPSRCRALRTKLKQAPSGIAERLRISSLQSVKARNAFALITGAAKHLHCAPVTATLDFAFHGCAHRAYRIPQAAASIRLPATCVNVSRAFSFLDNRAGLRKHMPRWGTHRALRATKDHCRHLWEPAGTDISVGPGWPPRA